jgi:hypothetical protein
MHFYGTSLNKTACNRKFHINFSLSPAGHLNALTERRSFAGQSGHQPDCGSADGPLALKAFDLGWG